MAIRSLETGRALEDAIDIVRNGGVIAFPTDTVYGIGASVSDPVALGRIFEIKGRSLSSNLPILISQVDAIDDLSSHADADLITLASAFWPGPLTVIVQGREGLPDAVVAADGTIGVRIPDHSIALAIAQGLGGAIAATSANRSGEPPACQASELPKELIQSLDVVLDGGLAPCSKASTVIRRVGDDIELVREGFLTANQIASAWQDIVPNGKVRTS